MLGVVIGLKKMVVIYVLVIVGTKLKNYKKGLNNILKAIEDTRK